MNHEIILHQFEQIEQKVENLIDARDALEAEILLLKDKIDTLENALQTKADVENSYAQAQEQIGQKVSSLLERLTVAPEVASQPETATEEQGRWS